MVEENYVPMVMRSSAPSIIQFWSVLPEMGLERTLLFWCCRFGGHRLMAFMFILTAFQSHIHLHHSTACNLSISELCFPTIWLRHVFQLIFAVPWVSWSYSQSSTDSCILQAQNWMRKSPFRTSHIAINPCKSIVNPWFPVSLRQTNMGRTIHHSSMIFPAKSFHLGRARRMTPEGNIVIVSHNKIEQWETSL